MSLIICSTIVVYLEHLKSPLPGLQAIQTLAVQQCITNSSSPLAPLSQPQKPPRRLRRLVVFFGIPVPGACFGFPRQLLGKGSP